MCDTVHTPAARSGSPCVVQCSESTRRLQNAEQEPLLGTQQYSVDNSSTIKPILTLPKITNGASTSFCEIQQQTSLPKFPVALVLAVCVDALVDGFLIGISSALGHSNAGVVMTVALSIEMGFLGMTFAASLRAQPATRRIPTIVAPPIFLLVGGKFVT